MNKTTTANNGFARPRTTLYRTRGTSSTLLHSHWVAKIIRAELIQHGLVGDPMHPIRPEIVGTFGQQRFMAAIYGRLVTDFGTDPQWWPMVQAAVLTSRPAAPLDQLSMEGGLR